MLTNIAIQSKATFSTAFLNACSQQTPFLLCDLNKIQKNYQKLKSTLTGFNVHYAVKANSNPELLARLAKIGCNFEIASANELKVLLRLDVSVDRVMYSNPVKPWQHIQEVFALGIDRFAFDSVSELEKLAKYAPGCKVYVRFRANDQGSTFPLSKKFGAEPQDVVPLMSMARDLGLRTYGLTFHVGSQSMDPRAWESGIKAASDVMRELQQHDIMVEMLDIGGGFPAYYGEDEPPTAHIGEVIAQAVERYLPYKVTLIAEPGRAIAADACAMVSTVIGRLVRGGKNWLFLDTSAFHGMMETLESNNAFYYPITTSRDGVSPGGDTALFTLTGPTCDSQDTMFYDIPLPRGIMTGDRIYIHSAGAYTTMYASFFNGFEPPKVYAVEQTSQHKEA